MTVGFRCFPSAISIVVVRGTPATPELIFEEHVEFPINEGRAGQLVWLRRQIIAYFDRFDATCAVFKRADTPRTDLQRAESEGVLQEAVASTGRSIEGRKLSQINRDTGYRARRPSEVKALFKHDAFKMLQKKRAQFEDAALAALCGLNGSF